MRPKILSIAAYAAANAAIIAASQTPAAGGVQALTLTSSPYTQDVARQVSITSAGNDTGRRFLIEGTDNRGRAILEAIAGASGAAAQTVRAFKTVTGIFVDGNTAAAVTAGTTTVVDTNWMPMDSLQPQFAATLFLEVPTGTATEDITVQITGSKLGWEGMNIPPIDAANKFSRIFPVLKIASHDTMVNVAAVGTTAGNIIVPVTALRLRSNAVFTGGPVTLTVTQTGHGA